MNPRTYPWGELTCGASGGELCSITLEPEGLRNVYPFPGEGATADMTDYSKFAKLVSLWGGVWGSSVVVGSAPVTRCLHSPSSSHGSSRVSDRPSRLSCG